MSRGNTAEIQIDGLGPFSEGNGIEFEYPFSCNRSIIYSKNGVGKTTISRAFRFQQQEAPGLLNLESSSGRFSYTVKDSQGSVAFSYELRIANEGEPQIAISDQDPLIFHVFNSDYIDSNLRETHYVPSGDITGYILGESNIDISEEEARITALALHRDEVYESLDDSINELRAALKSHGVRSNSNAFKEIDTQKLLNFDMAKDEY